MLSNFPLFAFTFTGAPTATAPLLGLLGAGAVSDFYYILGVLYLLFLLSAILPFDGAIVSVFYVYLNFVSACCRRGICLHIGTHCRFATVRRARAHVVCASRYQLRIIYRFEFIHALLFKSSLLIDYLFI